MNSFVFLSVCFTIFVLTFAWIFLTTEGRVWPKVLLSAAFVYLTINLAFSFNTFLGYPTSEKWIGKAQIVGVAIREPNEYKSDAGAIYFWTVQQNAPEQFKLFQIFKFHNEKNDPRAYVFPYSKDMQKAAQKAQDALAKGEAVDMEGQAGSGKKGDGKETKRAGGGNQYSQYDEESDVHYEITVRNSDAHGVKDSE